MTTSGYMPDVVVEIAFNAGWATPAASRTWTDVSAYVELTSNINIKFGRGDEFAVADANSLSLVLNNSDGRFTPEKASGAYYPNVKIGRPIRVTSTRVGGAASTRFLGFVNEWSLSSAGTNPTVTVTASSQLARLGTDTQLYASPASAFDESLEALFKLTEDALPVVDAMGHYGSLALAGSGSVTVHGGTGPDGEGTVFSWEDSADTTLSKTDGVYRTTPSPLLFEMFVCLTAGMSTSSSFYARLDGPHIFLQIDQSAGDWVAYVARTGGATTANHNFESTSADLHHVAAYHDGTAISLYFDGVLIDTVADVATLAASTGVSIFKGAGAGGTPSVSYVAVSSDLEGLFTRATIGLSAGQATATASERLEEYAEAADIESPDIDVTTEELLQYPLYDKTLLTAMRAAERSDGGVLFDAADGTLTFRARDSRYNTTSAFTLDAATQQVEANVAPKLDRSSMVNDATVTPTSGGQVGRAVDATSISAYGAVRSSWEVQGTQDQCYQSAAWAVALYAEPETRIPTLDVDLLPLSTSLQDSMLAASIGTHFTTTGLPTEFAASSIDFFVEGYSESIGPESYRISLNVSKRDPAKWIVWTVEDATYGQYDAYPIAL